MTRERLCAAIYGCGYRIRGGDYVNPRLPCEGTPLYLLANGGQVETVRVLPRTNANALLTRGGTVGGEVDAGVQTNAAFCSQARLTVAYTTQDDISALTLSRPDGFGKRRRREKRQGGAAEVGGYPPLAFARRGCPCTNVWL